MPGHYGSCYKLSSNTLGWYSAQSACEALGAKLAVLSSDVRQNVLAPNLVHTAWIGLHRDPKNKSRWLWVDGSSAMYTNWNYGEPNNRTDTGTRSEDCGEIYQSGKWNDNNCSNSLHYVCETGCKSDIILVKMAFLQVPSYLRVRLATTRARLSTQVCTTKLALAYGSVGQSLRTRRP